MPTIQQITPDENRTLLTTLGDWLSDGYWVLSAFPELYGLMRFDFDAAQDPQQAVLSHPHVTAGPGFTHTLAMFIYKVLFQNVGQLTWKLTDGNYSFQGTQTAPIDVTEWGFSANIDIPSDWIEANTQLIITIDSLDFDPFTIAIGRFSLSYLYGPHTDHLPLLGIG